jgi:ribonuclease P protein component
MGSERAWRLARAGRSSSAVVRRAASDCRPEERLVAYSRTRSVVKRRHRLSRSRDFDAVYRHGRSVATRYLVLYSFAREDESDAEPRLGLAVGRQLGTAVERNRLKRRLRGAFDELHGRVPGGRDYVLIARPGLPEAIDGRGFPWLVERVAEVFERAQVAERTAAPPPSP